MLFFKNWILSLGFGYALVFDFDAPDVYQLAENGVMVDYKRVSWILFKRV